VFDLATGMDMFWGVAGVVGGVASIAGLLWVSAKGHSDRTEEDAARDFYETHGHWPDEQR
jgi:predicted RNA-binding protein with PUA-like domain